MAIAFVFPGQGSQFVGMGKELVDHSPAARHLFQEVDDALNQNLSKIIFTGPNEELVLTRNTQPALMAVSMALLAAMEEQGFNIKDKVQYCAGHSLGEYSALAAAKSFTIADSAKLLRIRGAAMQEAVPIGCGAMAAIIGLGEEEVADLCSVANEKGFCQIANDNGGGQWVISGEKPGVEYAASLAKERGAKRSLLLAVSAPFHSALMQPAAKTMAQALDSVEAKDALIPIIPNVSIKPEQKITRLKALLVEQVTSRVRWRETIEWFSLNGVSKIYEIGAGTVLTGLIKRIDKNIELANIASWPDIEKALTDLS